MSEASLKYLTPNDCALRNKLIFAAALISQFLQRID
jgi:hypothetical protein